MKTQKSSKYVCPRAQNYQNAHFCTDGMRFGTSGEVCGPDMSGLEPCEYEKPWQNQGKYGKTVKNHEHHENHGFSWSFMGIHGFQGVARVATTLPEKCGTTLDTNCFLENFPKCVR